MCVVSMVGDHYTDKWKYVEPRLVPYTPTPIVINPQPQVSREEFDQLKRDMAEMLSLLKRAKKYDEANGEPDCEMDEKMKVLRTVAGAVGIDLDKALRNGDVYRVIDGELVKILPGHPSDLAS